MGKQVCRGKAEAPGFEKQYGAIEKIKKMIRTGDRLKLLTPESGYDTGAKNTVTEGIVCGTYKYHLLVDNGKWKESVTWANLIKDNLLAWINGKRFTFWD